MNRTLARRVLVRVVAVAVATVGAGLAPIALSPGVDAAEGDVGARAFKYGPGLTGSFIEPDDSPTATKPQSKLWFAQGQWWGVMLNDSTNSFHVYSYNSGADRWSDTGVVVDTREKAKVDVLWDGSMLYTVAAVMPGATTRPEEAIRFARFTYDTASKKYVQQGTTRAINGGGVEAAVIAKDSTNRLWVAYTSSTGTNTRQLRLLVGANGGASWGDPMSPPVPDVTGLSDDDIAAVVAHGSSISVVWSKQVEGTGSKIVVATHPDGAAVDAGWDPEDLIVGTGVADDHLNMSVDGDGSGRVFVVAKESTGDGDNPDQEGALIRLFVLIDGTWTNYVHSRVRDDMTRPIVAVDKDSNRLRVFATAPVEGGVVYEKSIPLDTLGDFPTGRGDPVLKLASDTFINNTTTTKQNRTPDSGLMLLASDQKTGYYVYNANTVPAADPTADFVFEPMKSTNPLAVSFTSTATNAKAWAWDFDNNGTVDSQEAAATYVYPASGVYTAKLTVTNKDNETAFVTKTVTVDGSSTAEGPRTRMIEPTTMFTRDGFVDVAWGPLTNADKVATYTVRRKASTVNSTFRSETNWRTATGARAGGFVGSPGATYCMRVQGTDAAGNIGKWSSARCTAVPLDDRRLNKSTQWKTVKNRAAYLETLLKTRSSGARLTKKVAGKHVSLVVTKSPGSGRIAIYKGRTLVKRVSLDAAQRRDKVFIPVLATTRVQTSNIRVVVLTRGKPVLIDGLAVSRR